MATRIDKIIEEKEKKKQKPITLVEWGKRAKKLKKEYPTYAKLKTDCIKRLGGTTYFAIFDTVEGLLSIMPSNVLEGIKHDRIHPSRDTVSFIAQKDGSYVKTDQEKMIAEITPIIKKIHDKGSNSDAFA